MTTITGVFEPFVFEAVETKQKCSRCGAMFSPDMDIIEAFPSIADVCDDCLDVAYSVAEDAEKFREKKRAEDAFAAICPPDYRNPDESKFPSAWKEIAKNFRSTIDRGMGAGLRGATGTGKTTFAYYLLRKASVEYGMKCYSISAMTLSRYSVEQFNSSKDRKYEAENALREIKHCGVLLLDDLGKARMSERYEAEIFDMVEYRTSWHKPIIWTSNATPEQLSAMFGADRGDPIMRRLLQRCVTA